MSGLTRDSEVAAILETKEDEHLECKKAQNKYDFQKLVKYCAALANEGGGRFVMGITERVPRQVVGTSEFPDLGRTKQAIVDRLHLRIEAREIHDSQGRVVIFAVPSRPLGYPIHYKGAYWMRSGDSLVPMTHDQIRRILDETGPDFTAEICQRATINDLAPDAIEEFRLRWRRKSGNTSLLSMEHEQLLADAELLVDGGVTYAALVLLGTRSALARHLGQAEVVFEYRASEASGPAQEREEYREGFFLYYDRLWETINLRNDKQHFQDGLFMMDIPTFSEEVIREAILNAVSHRDYRLASSVFIRQYARRIEVESPGGLPPGITVSNMLWRQSPRNRRVAEAFAKCGLVERSGQGVNRMFEQSIKESKPTPDYSRTDNYQVAVTLNGAVQDLKFLRFLERIGQETAALFDTNDFLTLDHVHRERKLPDALGPSAQHLVNEGILERVGRGRGTRYILSRRFYDFLGKKGAYTRKRGLDRETNKELLAKHIAEHGEEGAGIRELQQVLPTLSRSQVHTLLRELKREGRAHVRGAKRGARWFPGAESNEA